MKLFLSRTFYAELSNRQAQDGFEGSARLRRSTAKLPRLYKRISIPVHLFKIRNFVYFSFLSDTRDLTSDLFSARYFCNCLCICSINKFIRLVSTDIFIFILIYTQGNPSSLQCGKIGIPWNTFFFGKS